MNHAEVFEDQVIQYADGEMSDSDREAFEAHLAQCEDCANAVREHHDALNLVREGLAAVPSTGALTVEAVQFRAATRRATGRVAVAATCVLMVAFSAFALLRSPEVEPSPGMNEVTAQDELELQLLERRIAVLEAQLERMQTELERDAELAAMNTELSDREIAAIALAAAQHLEASGLDVAGARRQYQLVIEHFAHTPAADVARQHLSAT